MRVCLLYIDNIVILLTISFTRHANILVYLHKYISWYIAKFSFIVFFFFPHLSIKCAPVLFCCTESEN